MIDYIRTIIVDQFEAALCMMNDCVRRCPPQHWEGMIAKYPFWHVAYHTLCSADLYLSLDEAAFELRPNLHPGGERELSDEYPSRQFAKDEIEKYLNICRDKATKTIAQETEASLKIQCGFGWLPGISRGELHIYNLRHIQHHAGQLSAFLRKFDPPLEPKWVKKGWSVTA